MNSIASSANASATQQLPAPRANDSTDAASSGQGGDLLAAMNPAMDAAFAVGRPTDRQGAAAILATTGAYIAGANATIDKLDEGIRRREHELEQLRISDPDAAADKAGQLDLLRKLRDRIQLSIERVSRTAVGEDDGDADNDDLDAQATKRREELELLEQRRVLLAGSATGMMPTDSSIVASTYSANERTHPH